MRKLLCKTRRGNSVCRVFLLHDMFDPINVSICGHPWPASMGIHGPARMDVPEPVSMAIHKPVCMGVPEPVSTVAPGPVSVGILLMALVFI